MPPKLVYIAGPYRAGDRWTEERNVRAAEDAARDIAELGGMPVCPHANTRPYFSDLQSAEWWLEGTMELMRRCDAVYMLEGWMRSSGARAEEREALKLEIPVFYARDVEPTLDFYLRPEEKGEK